MNDITKKLVAAAMTVGLMAAIATQKVSAGVTDSYGGNGCVPIYGGGVRCPRPGEIIIDKTVQNPSTGVFVDNLGPNDPKYRSEQIVPFHVTVRNPGDQSLDWVTVIDTLPSYVDFSSGPAGSSYDANTRKVTWTVNNLGAGDSQTFTINVRVQHEALLPKDRNVICPTNANPQPDNVVDVGTSNGQTDRDDAKFCIEKKLVVPNVPKAGPEEWLLTLMGLGASMKAGLVLRKKANNK